MTTTLSVRFKLDRHADFDPEIQYDVEPRLDFIPINIPTIYHTKQFEFSYSDSKPLTIISLEEELRVGPK